MRRYRAIIIIAHGAKRTILGTPTGNRHLVRFRSFYVLVERFLLFQQAALARLQ